MPFFGDASCNMVDDEGYARPRRTARPLPRQATLADFIKVKATKQGNRFKALATDDDHAALLLPHDTTRHDTTRHDPAIRFKTKSPCGSAEPSGR